MNGEKLRIDRPVVVEGKYDKIKLSSILDADILVTDGFGIFREEEKLALIRRIAEKSGVIVLTDSDGAGLVIRNYFNSALPRDKVTHLYIPEIPGRERRKKTASKAGFLGVEGVDCALLRKLFEPFAEGARSAKPSREVTKTDFYTAGLSGGPSSAARRAELAKKLGLPRDMSANALLAAVNLLGAADSFDEFIGSAENDAPPEK